MSTIVLGIDALDPELVDPEHHPNLTLASHRRIETINSTAGEPSTHELWPTIITGLSPAEHGLQLSDGVAWENPLLSAGSAVAKYALPNGLRTRIGAWLLNNTEQDQFRVPSSYYQQHDLETVFDNYEAKPIGIPNYVIDTDAEDREHQLRRRLGEFFERTPDTKSGHSSADPEQFYELCLEMAMIRIARVRRALRSQQYELVFGYTSGLDLIGHIAYDVPEMQPAAYKELDEFVGDLLADIGDEDMLLLVSDHGLQDGVHTEEAMVACTDPSVVDRIDSVQTVRQGIEYALENADTSPTGRRFTRNRSSTQSDQVKEQLESLGYV